MRMHHFNIHICCRSQVQAFVALAMVQPFEVLVGNEKQQINGLADQSLLFADWLGLRWRYLGLRPDFFGFSLPSAVFSAADCA